MTTITQEFEKSNLNSRKANHRFDYLDTPIEGTLRWDRRYFHIWFEKLAAANILTMRDLLNYTPEQLFSAAPTSEANRKRFMAYVNNGIIGLRNSAHPPLQDSKELPFT